MSVCTNSIASGLFIKIYQALPLKELQVLTWPQNAPNLNLIEPHGACRSMGAIGECCCHGGGYFVWNNVWEGLWVKKHDDNDTEGFHRGRGAAAMICQWDIRMDFMHHKHFLCMFHVSSCVRKHPSASMYRCALTRVMQSVCI